MEQRDMTETHYFVYSIDVLQVTGEMTAELMILDHEELYEIMENARNSGETILNVNVSMYNEAGACVNERDITRWLIKGN